MERTKPTTVWIDGKEVGTNSNISTAQQYELSSYLSPGSHDIAIIVDNGKQAVPEKVYGSSHAYSSSTQTNWNGIIGDFFHKIHSFSSRYLITSQSCRISAFYIRSRNKSTIKRISYVLFGIQSETVLLSTGSFWGFLPVLIPVVFSIHMRFLVCTFSSRIRDFGADSPALGAGKLVLVRKKSFVGQGHNLLCSLEQRILINSDCHATFTQKEFFSDQILFQYPLLKRSITAWLSVSIRTSGDI